MTELKKVRTFNWFSQTDLDAVGKTNLATSNSAIENVATQNETADKVLPSFSF